MCCSTESLEAEELGFRNRFHAFICPDDTAIDVAVILTQQRDEWSISGNTGRYMYLEHQPEQKLFIVVE